MAVNELDRDFLRLLHHCDLIEDIMANRKMATEEDAEKKQNVGNIVQLLESEMLDTKWTDAGKDVTRINEVITSGRAYYRS